MRRNLDNDHAKNDLFGSNDLNDMTKILRNIVKKGVHVLLFSTICSLVRGSYFREKEDRTSTREDSTKDESNSEESKSAKLQPVFQIEHYALEYFRRVGSYRQTTGGKRASHKSVVEMVTHLW